MSDQTMSDQKTIRDEIKKRTLAFFQTSDDPIADYFELVKALYRSRIKKRDRAESVLEITLDVLTKCYVHKMTLEQVARTRNITRERVRQIKERAEIFVQRRYSIDLRQLLRLIQEAEKA